MSKLFDSKLQTLLIECSFVAEVPDCKILNWTYRTYDDPTSMLEMLLKRTLTLNESRKYTLQNLSNLTTQLETALEEYSNSTLQDILLETLVEFNKGILRLRESYSDCSDTRKHFKDILDRIDLLLRIYSTEIKLIEEKKNRLNRCELLEKKLKDKEESLNRMCIYYDIVKQELEKWENKLEDRRQEVLSLFEKLGLKEPFDIIMNIPKHISNISLNKIEDSKGSVNIDGVLELYLINSKENIE